MNYILREESLAEIVQDYIEDNLKLRNGDGVKVKFFYDIENTSIEACVEIVRKDNFE